MAALVTSIGAAAVATGAGVVLADEDRRHQLERQLRVWRLTARRTLHYGTVWVRGRRATAEERARLEERFAIRTAEDVAEVLGGMKGAIMKAGQMVSFIAEGLPPEAQAARIMGVIFLEVTIAPDGSVADAKVLRSIPMLDQPALDAVRQWKFTPTLMNGQPVPIIMTVTVNFSLQ